MKKNKSIVRKYFLICSGIIISAVIILGVMILAFSSGFFASEKTALLKTNVDTATTIVENTLKPNGDIDLEEVKSVLNLLSNSINAAFFIVNPDGYIICSGEHHAPTEKQSEHEFTVIPKEILKNLNENQNNEYFDYLFLNGLYSSKHYTYGTAIKSPITKGNIGYIFASSNIDYELGAYLQNLFQMILLSSIIVIIFSTIVTYFISFKLVKPLRSMVNATKKIGKGDFSVRVPVLSDDEVGDLATELNNMAMSLSRQESIQRNFTANISHELKTPMTSISGFVDGILDGTIKKEKQNYYLRLVSDEVKRLSRLVKTMLNLSKIEAGQMNINRIEFNILDVIIQVLFSFEKNINDKNIDIRGIEADDILVNGDIDLLTQVVYNLIENAVKFTNVDGYIEFSFYEDEKYINISIKNSGEGLSKEDRQKVFERFYKSDRSRGLDKNGAGLGLYIVRSIIIEHMGKIEVNSEYNEYTQFIISLPK